jgi:hypothetical protein
MKRISAFLGFVGIFVLLSIQASGQNGNEWINYSRSYYKIPTAKNGIYKLTYTDLANAGVPVPSLDPSTLQIYHRGTEQSIYVAGEEDHQFDPVDFVEFYGRRNDGTQDAELYKPSSSQPHPYHNLYSDTTAYFLTYGGMNGKRMPLFSEANVGMLPDVFHMNEKLQVNAEAYSAGISFFNDQILNTYFDQAEGWTGLRIQVNQTRTYSINSVIRGETQSGKPHLEVFLMGMTSAEHQAQITIGQSNRLWKTVDLSGHSVTSVSDDVEWSDIDASGVLQVTAKTVVGRVSVSYIRLNFPQNFNAAGETEKVMHLRENPAGKSYIEIQNPGAGLRLFDITDPNNLVRIGTTSSSTLNAIVPNTASSRILLATATTITPKIYPVTFRNIDPADYDYIMLTHPLLRRPAGSYSDPVEAYAEYRASPKGGGYSALLLNIQDVYNQFNYGELSPLAIHHLMRYLTSVKVPRYFFIVGKGLDINYNYNRNQSAATFNVYKDLIPSAGIPASDILYTAGLAGSSFEPGVPTGRLSATSSAQVAAYLDKVIETETQPFSDLQKKNILHLSGGIEDGEHERFKRYVDDFKEVAEGYHLGGKVESIAKHSTDVKLISIAEEVNKGLGLVTFFGHSSATTLDFDIGYVTNPVMGYDNKGKYPIMLMHGCNVGAFFLTNTAFGEDWILAANKGAIGFVAHSYFGFESNLKLYGDSFYQAGYGDSVLVSRGIGDILKETSRRYMLHSTPSFSNTTQAQQMILLGDPAALLFGATKPDLEINTGSISFQSFNGEPVTALSDSFKINIVVRNLGLAKPGLFRIQVERLLGDNTSIITDTIIDPVLYSDTIAFTVRKPHQMGFGTNTFNITLDADNLIDELNESNNVVSRELFIPRNGTKNLFPRNFAIVNQEETTLSWQTTDVLSDQRNFILEVDTASAFNSPYKKTFTLNTKVLARQSITLLGVDTLAYYWRTKLADPQEGESDQWENSSFTMIKNSAEGWAQVQFPQYTDNGMDGLIADPALRKIKFQETVTDINIVNFGTNHVATNRDVKVKIKGVEYNLFTQSDGGFGCRDNSINLIAFDRRSTAPYLGIPFKWYNRANRACGREPWVINNFRPAQMVTGNNDDIIAYVDNIPAGDSVVIFSIGNAAYNLWPAAAKTKLGELGISVAQIDVLVPNEPVIIFGRKGTAPGSAKVFRAPVSPVTAELKVDKTITGRYTSGSMTSALVGPAAAWDSFDQRFTHKELQDEIHYEIVGVKLNGTEELLFADVVTDQDLSGISATQYPYLKIVARVEDDINLTSPQVKHWIVLYTPVPEGLVTFFGPREQQSVPAGVTWSGDYGFINISDKNFSDSLVVRYDTYNYQQGILETNTLKIKAPLPGDTTVFDVEIDTDHKSGLNDIDVFVNPRIAAEQYFDNNVMSLVGHLNVEADGFNPVLEVTIDGRRVIDGDFVSPDPVILVNVWDENSNLLKGDPAGMKILLAYPCEDDDCDPVTIDLSGEQIVWYPATSTIPFRMEFRPTSLPDGRYRLHVEGADASGNTSGVVPYEISFNVQAEETVSILPPYPNPFSYEVNFTVVLTGDELPEQMLLQISDVNGKVVREFFPDHVNVGTNVWVWDGTDQNGNTLSKGLYFYKANLVINGKQHQKVSKIVLMK